MTMTYHLDGLTTGRDALHGAEAQQAWRQWCSDVHGEFDIDFDHDSYRGRVVRQRSSTYQLVGWTSERELVRRERRGISRDPRGHYEVFVPIKGELRVGQDSPDQPLEVGQMALVPIDAPFQLGQTEDAVAMAFLVPFERIDQRLGRVASRGQQVLATSGMARVARDLLMSLVREREHLTAVEFDAACDRVVDLFCLAASDDHHAATPVGDAAVLDAVRSHIRCHATDLNLNVAGLATAVGWSARHIQAVLARAGTTARELIRAERLELARAKLANPALAHLTVASIGSSVGFSSPSAFSHAYRQHFGCSPRDTRAF